MERNHTAEQSRVEWCKSMSSDVWSDVRVCRQGFVVM